VWHDVKVGVAFIVLTAALGAWVFDLPVAQVTVVGLLASVLVLLLVFVMQLAGVVRHPDRHRSWRRGEPTVLKERDHQGPAMASFFAYPLEALYVGRNKAEVTDPDGNVWEQDSAQKLSQADVSPSLTRALIVYYPLSFPGAPPLRTGTYEVRWLVGTRRGGWREILRYTEQIRVD
jgi:hypothetical protein